MIQFDTTKIKVAVFLALGALLLWGCNEEPLRVTLIQPEPADRNILVEEFTGVRCVNCPQGTDEILNLQAIYGKNVVAVAIHAGFFAQRYPDSKFDFKIPQGTAIEEWLGAPLGYPAAVINRTLFPGEQSKQLPRQSWAGHIANELSKQPAVRITVQTNFDISTRELEAKVLIVAEQNINHPTRLSIMLTEDNIIDPQADVAAPGGKTVDYLHKHVLREMLTNFDGNPLAENMQRGQVIERNFKYTIPQSELPWWKVEDMHLLAFVTAAGGGSPGEVLNVEEVSFAN